MTSTPKRGFLIAILVVGLGVAAAPAIFQLFTRAPGGGRMIDSFQPIMTQSKVTAFRGYMAEIGAAEAEAAGPLTQTIAARTKKAPAGASQDFASVASFERQWPIIDSDMSSMLATMQRDLPDYQAVKALPPFWMFPWFFVLPGLIIAGFAAFVLRRSRQARPARWGVAVLGVLGIALVAAPVAFQMFTRAPRGAQMISDFKPLMTPAKVTTVQGYFLTIGAAEGQLRTEVLPSIPAAATTFPAIARWSRDWPHISEEMAPMIGAMSDNLANFSGIAALPPFWLFPWFFVLPGLLVLGLAVAARGRVVPAPPPDPLPPTPEPVVADDPQEATRV